MVGVDHRRLMLLLGFVDPPKWLGAALHLLAYLVGKFVQYCLTNWMLVSSCLSAMYVPCHVHYFWVCCFWIFRSWIDCSWADRVWIGGSVRKRQEETKGSKRHRAREKVSMGGSLSIARHHEEPTTPQNSKPKASKHNTQELRTISSAIRCVSEALVKNSDSNSSSPWER